MNFFYFFSAEVKYFEEVVEEQKTALEQTDKVHENWKPHLTSYLQKMAYFKLVQTSFETLAKKLIEGKKYFIICQYSIAIFNYLLGIKEKLTSSIS